MAIVPNLEAPDVQPEPLPGRAYPRIDTEVPGAAFGETLGRGLEEAGDVGSEEEAKAKRENDQLRVIDANTQLEAFQTSLLYGKPGTDGNMQGGAFAMHGLDAINMPAKILPQYEQYAAQLSSTLTPDQQALFSAHVDAGKSALNLQLNRYENEEGNRLATQTYANATEQAIEGASVGWRDPIAIGKGRADIKALVAMQGSREGWGTDEVNAQTQKLLAEMHYSVIDRMLADGNPQAALRYFVGTKDEAGIRDSNELTGEQAHQLGAAIDEAMRQQQSQVTSTVEAKVRDVRAAAVNGLLVPPSARPTDGELRAAYGQQWTQVRDAITRDVAMGADLKSMASMTPQQLAAHVDAYRPTSVAGAADSFDRYQIASTAAQRIMAERAADPRQYAIDHELGSHPLDFQHPDALGQELKTRIAGTTTLSAQLGGNVPPLTRNEAAQLSSTLENQTPAQRLQTLATLHTASGSDRGFQDVMRQILPGSPVTAIVGTRVTSGSPQELPAWFDRGFASNPQDQATILAGERLLNPQGTDKEGEKTRGKAFPMPPDAGMNGLRDQFSEASGDMFRGRPELADAYFAAFKSAYAGLLAQKGDSSGNGDLSLRDQALKMVLGNHTTIGGHTVAVPDGMDPGRFEGLVHNAIGSRAQAYGAPANWEDHIRGYSLIELGDVGSGRYQLASGNGVILKPDGSAPFEIDLRRQYLPSEGARPSAEDAARLAADRPGRQPGVSSLAGGSSSKLTRGTPAPAAVKAPPLGVRAGGGKGVRAHPSQAPDVT